MTGRGSGLQMWADVTVEVPRGGKVEIGAGAGKIVAADLPDDASATITADTGSGTITADVPGVEIERSERNHMVCRVGDGRARVSLDAGSGFIKITQ